MKLNMQENPAVIVGGSVSAVVVVVIALLRAFNVDVTADQENAIKDAAVVLLPLVTALLIRMKVFSPKSYAEKTYSDRRST